MKNEFLTRKEKIIISIVDLINEIGIKELSIKEIAKRENITEAAIYKHFQSKEQMLLEVLKYYSKYDNYKERFLMKKKVMILMTTVILAIGGITVAYAHGKSS